MFQKHFISAPDVRPSLNIGCLFDVPTGSYFVGKHGESILNGGLMYVTGLGGRGNTYKSTVGHFMILRALDRYNNSIANFYDTEPPSISKKRIRGLSKSMDHISTEDIFTSGRATISDSTTMSGNVWFEALKEYSKEKHSKENIKKNMFTTPFFDDEGEPIKTLQPTFFEIDSLSMMSFDSVEAMQDKNMVGEAGLNTESMKASAAKSQMMVQFPAVTGNNNNFIIATAHMGDEIVMDKYAVSTKKLTFLKNQLKFKNVPEKFTFLTNNCYLTLSAQVLAHDTTKAPLYPRGPEDNMKGDTDLQLVTVQNVRAKNGPTGMPFELIVSQKEGLLVGLSEFNYIKNYDRFGLGGNLQNFFLELVPDINLSRTTIRSKIDESPKLRRALEITSELCQIFNFNRDLEEKYAFRPEEVYKILKEKGYDWDVLLNTRGYWVYEETPHELNFLSTMDLLKMCAGDYHPYWLEKK